jgi:hypothetical protein
MERTAIVVLADTETHELGRMVNVLSTADEFKENGDEVTIIFDGAGVRWAAELSKPDHRLHEPIREASRQGRRRLPLLRRRLRGTWRAALARR